MHTQMKQFCSKSTRFNPYFGSKVGIKSCRFAIECVSFVHAWMYVTSYPAGIVFTCFLTFYCDPSSGPFLNFYLSLVCLLFKPGMWKAARIWYLKIALVGMSVCTSVCVCPPPRPLITGGVI